MSNKKKANNIIVHGVSEESALLVFCSSCGSSFSTSSTSSTTFFGVLQVGADVDRGLFGHLYIKPILKVLPGDSFRLFTTA